MPETTATARPRNAERSRAAILTAAERLFAEQGFDRTSLAEIAAAAGLSRGAPSYFFASKEHLYEAVLGRVFAERQDATREAFGALTGWAGGGRGSLAGALGKAVEGYLEFLLGHPGFVRLLQREDLSGGAHLRAAARESRAMTDAFEALRRAAPTRGLRRFSVEDAVLLFVSLTFSPLTHRATFLASIGRDLGDPSVRRRHVAFVVDQLSHLLGGG
jgi:TetR/AcrR family transcriptional regulator